MANNISGPSESKVELKLFDTMRTLLYPFVPTARAFKDGYHEGLYGTMEIENIQKLGKYNFSRFNKPKTRAFFKGFKEGAALFSNTMNFRKSMMKVLGLKFKKN